MRPLRIETNSAEETREFGRHLGRAIDESMVVALFGDLGCGKTVLVQGLAQGVGVMRGHYVTSPSYTLINEYNGRLPFYHIDLYRLAGVDDAEAIGLFDLLSQPGVFAIEWAQRLDTKMLGRHLALTIGWVDDKRRSISTEAHGRNVQKIIAAAGTFKSKPA
jgi:tRNA threonylcarbamoyladenosine biosynthesis protein TsaE